MRSSSQSLVSSGDPVIGEMVRQPVIGFIELLLDPVHDALSRRKGGRPGELHGVRQEGLLILVDELSNELMNVQPAPLQRRRAAAQNRPSGRGIPRYRVSSKAYGFVRRACER
jgi:hypothetical protein